MKPKTTNKHETGKNTTHTNKQQQHNKKT